MNLNELFFFKVLECHKTNNNISTGKQHNEKNCYFYHVSTTYRDNEKIDIPKDRRRIPIDFLNFFNYLNKEQSKSEAKELTLENLYEFKNNNYLQYYSKDVSFNSIDDAIFDVGFSFSKNELEYSYHMENYQNEECRNFKICNKCLNKFCNRKHIIKNQKDTNFEGIEKYRQIISDWKNKNEIELKEIIKLYDYILSFKNKFLSQIQINELQENFLIFKKWYDKINTNLSHYSFRNMQKSENKLSNQQIINEIYNRFIIDQSKIEKNLDIIQALQKLNIKPDLMYLSKNSTPKQSEIFKVIPAFLNSHDGILIYGVDINDHIVKGISMKKKYRNIFKSWFNKEYFKVMVEYEDYIKYDFYDLLNNNNDECLLIIQVKKVKLNKLVNETESGKSAIIKDKFLEKLNKKKEINEELYLVNEEDIKELDVREYLEVLRERLIKYYTKKYKKENLKKKKEK